MSQINTNTYSLNAQRNLAKNSLGLSSAIERLSSGLRVNSAKDDASGLAVGLSKESAARTTAVGIRESQDKISNAQIADGAMGVVGDIVMRIIELNDMKTAASASGATGTEYDQEMAKLASTANDIQTKAQTAAGSATFTSITVTSAANTAMLTSVTNERAKLGATMNNEEYNIQSKRVMYENQQAARSRIMDADFAEETSRLSRFQVLQQAGTAMVAQANAIPQNVLSLLR
ncbi:flagellin [Azonexus fungiphilus]|uniref:flagellin n=1 Tax=Azonexus fungiphilus TaxID=146940 RepID=UPI00156BB796|nr:flagellin [Azonexus fungiphilus]NHC07256.1 flagellin FliC [Azonexus fungiphilus]